MASRRNSAFVGLLCFTVVLHVAQVTWYTAPGPELDAADAVIAARVRNAGARTSALGTEQARSRMLIVTATQPAPCTTQHGDYIVQLALKNKLQYATLHGYSVWASTELLSPWDLGGQWNKVALLSVLAEANSSAGAGFDWLLWVDDDAIFCDVTFTFPFEAYDADGTNLVLWGDDGMTYRDGNSEGVNTGTMLLRRCEWTRQLLAAWAALASSPVRETLVNHDQGGGRHTGFRPATDPPRTRHAPDAPDAAEASKPASCVPTPLLTRAAGLVYRYIRCIRYSVPSVPSVTPFHPLHPLLGRQGSSTCCTTSQRGGGRRRSSSATSR